MRRTKAAAGLASDVAPSRPRAGISVLCYPVAGWGGGREGSLGSLLGGRRPHEGPTPRPKHPPNPRLPEPSCHFHVGVWGAPTSL